MRRKSYLLNLFGVTAGDEGAVVRNRSVLKYLILSGYRSLLRLAANHCILPSLRVSLFRWSGIRIGRGVQINMNINFIDDFVPGSICLEDGVAVAPFVSFVASSHPNNSILYTEYNIKKSGRILVKEGAWLGVGSVIMPGITVGKAAIIGANAVVTKDVEDFSIMLGIPAKRTGDVRSHKSMCTPETLEKNNNVQ